MFRFLVSLFVLSTFPVGVSLAQASRPSTTDSADAVVRRAASSAETGHCSEALPTLKRGTAHVTDKALKLKAATAMLRCALASDDRNSAIEALQIVNRDFSHDPEALYIMIHAFSDLSERTSIDLARFGSNSPQAHELNAEALEMQGKWDEAAKEYRWIEQNDPDMVGIHFRLGRLLLSKPNPSPSEAEQAKAEMQQELKIDPNNAGAEYVLGELARQANEYSAAIEHFARASKIDASFADAFLGLGSSFVAEKKFSEAIPPLETATKLEPTNPTAHYNLAMAYSRVGRKQDADREFALHQEMQKQAADATHGAENQGTPSQK